MPNPLNTFQHFRVLKLSSVGFVCWHSLHHSMFVLIHTQLSLAIGHCVVGIFAAHLFPRRRGGKDCGALQGGSGLVGIINASHSWSKSASLGKEACG